MSSIDYTEKLTYHFRPKKGWINDPNGLVYFKDYYHVFYQYAPDYETPWKQPMHWGHARTKDFLNWEELPVALYPDKDYDNRGCWSGTAIVKNDVMYLFYTSLRSKEKEQTVSVAYSTDGIRFEKYSQNPVISHYPADGGPDFRDPAVCRIDGKYYCVMATGNPETKSGRLLIYKSENLFDWEYEGIMCEWQNCRYTECPSFMEAGNGSHLLAASVCPLESEHFFSVMYGEFTNKKFNIRYSAEIDKGPDQYAGQVFRDHLGRNILITWIPGWDYIGFAEKNIGCMSVPREITIKNGKITAFPIKEVQHLLKDSDPAVKLTKTGFVIERYKRAPVIYNGEINELKIIRDEYIVEVFVNGGEKVFTALL